MAHWSRTSGSGSEWVGCQPRARGDLIELAARFGGRAVEPVVGGLCITYWTADRSPSRRSNRSRTPSRSRTPTSRDAGLATNGHVGDPVQPVTVRLDGDGHDAPATPAHRYQLTEKLGEQLLTGVRQYRILWEGARR